MYTLTVRHLFFLAHITNIYSFLTFFHSLMHIISIKFTKKIFVPYG